MESKKAQFAPFLMKTEKVKNKAQRIKLESPSAMNLGNVNQHFIIPKKGSNFEPFLHTLYFMLYSLCFYSTSSSSKSIVFARA